MKPNQVLNKYFKNFSIIEFNTRKKINFIYKMVIKNSNKISIYYFYYDNISTFNNLYFHLPKIKIACIIERKNKNGRN